jgi:hypothetical protein
VVGGVDVVELVAGAVVLDVGGVVASGERVVSGAVELDVGGGVVGPSETAVAWGDMSTAAGWAHAPMKSMARRTVEIRVLMA